MQNSRPLAGGSFAQSAHVPTDTFQSVADFRDWFAEHFSLDGKPYTLDLDQARAVLDNHKNTLATARAGSGKTRVIVAKVAYLLATEQLRPEEIAVFMFNRTAALEVNQRIAKVEFDGQAISQIIKTRPSSADITIASTFHKFALDLMKLSGVRPELISESEHDQIIERSLRQVLAREKRRVSAREFNELLSIISSFIARAGQKYSGTDGLRELRSAVEQYISSQPSSEKSRLHRLALMTFENYLATLRLPKLDFNIMMSEASELLRQTAASPSRYRAIHDRVSPLKIILIDEYQDFSQLFLNLVQSLRQNCPSAHVFAVGDDWQAINRFAGSDVEYFINFADYFPEDTINIPLMTNYRSCRRIVENANDYMLKNYDPDASRAVPFNRESGKIIRKNPGKIRFDAGDIREDALGDARYQIALAKSIKQTTNIAMNPAKVSPSAAKLLKSTYKILRKNRKQEIMLLHRHNFTTFPGIALETFHQALKLIAVEEGIMNAEDFDARVRCMTMHKSKGLEAEVIIILEANEDLILGHHPNADLWQIFGDNHDVEKSDQHRLLYVAMTRAKQKLYILSTDRRSPL